MKKHYLHINEDSAFTFAKPTVQTAIRNVSSFIIHHQSFKIECPVRIRYGFQHLVYFLFVTFNVQNVLYIIRHSFSPPSFFLTSACWTADNFHFLTHFLLNFSNSFWLSLSEIFLILAIKKEQNIEFCSQK